MILVRPLIEQVIEAAQKAVPKEMCGLLFSGPWVNGFYQATNAATNHEHEFLIDHMDYLTACMQFDGKPWAIVHSHPTSGAAPSVKDCRLMDAFQVSGHDLAMVIVGLQPVEIRIFRKHGERYKLEWVHALSSL